MVATKKLKKPTPSTIKSAAAGRPSAVTEAMSPTEQNSNELHSQHQLVSKSKLKIYLKHVLRVADCSIVQLMSTKRARIAKVVSELSRASCGLTAS